jgi:hypothetical protein
VIRICCRCKKVLGEKAPFEDKRETHTYCDQCLKIMVTQMKKMGMGHRAEGIGSTNEK